MKKSKIPAPLWLELVADRVPSLARYHWAALCCILSSCCAPYLCRPRNALHSAFTTYRFDCKCWQPVGYSIRSSWGLTSFRSKMKMFSRWQLLWVVGEIASGASECRWSSTSAMAVSIWWTTNGSSHPHSRERSRHQARRWSGGWGRIARVSGSLFLRHNFNDACRLRLLERQEADWTWERVRTIRQLHISRTWERLRRARVSTNNYPPILPASRPFSAPVAAQIENPAQYESSYLLVAAAPKAHELTDGGRYHQFIVSVTSEQVEVINLLLTPNVNFLHFFRL